MLADNNDQLAEISNRPITSARTEADFKTMMLAIVEAGKYAYLSKATTICNVRYLPTQDEDIIDDSYITVRQDTPVRS